jgi:hypothetical protein
MNSNVRVYSLNLSQSVNFRSRFLPDHLFSFYVQAIVPSVHLQFSFYCDLQSCRVIKSKKSTSNLLKFLNTNIYETLALNVDYLQMSDTE